MSANLKIVSWNVNSVRIRLEMLKHFLQTENPDILCLQETKVSNELFPVSFFNNLGYEYIEFSGQKSYHGVAIISKLPLLKPHEIEFIEGQKRHFCVEIYSNELKDHFILHNFYVPAGGDVPSLDSQKFADKISMIEKMQEFFQKNTKINSKVILLGDFNIAPHEHDVWSHTSLKNVVSHTEIERRSLQSLKESFPFKMFDVARDVNCQLDHGMGKNFKNMNDNKKIYSWWSYRNRDWKKSNRGRRLDHLWVSEGLISSFQDLDILIDWRDHQKPSDHVPVVGRFKL